MQDDLRKAVFCLRLGMEGAGNHHLATFLQKLSGHLARPDIAAATPLPLLLPHIQALVEAQERGDYLRAADLLEYEIRPLL